MDSQQQKPRAWARSFSHGLRSIAVERQAFVRMAVPLDIWMHTKGAQRPAGEGLLYCDEGCGSGSFTALASRAHNRDDALVLLSLERSLRNEVHRHMNKLFPKPLEKSKLWNRSDGLQQPDFQLQWMPLVKDHSYCPLKSTAVFVLRLYMTWVTRPDCSRDSGISWWLACCIDHPSIKCTFPFSFTWGQTCMSIWWSLSSL